MADGANARMVAAANERWSYEPTEMETGTEDGDSGRRQRWDDDGTRVEERKLERRRRRSGAEDDEEEEEMDGGAS
uniref:Uncharacterized protein n=1 Tax=Cucumis melo subsp. melo TaxID=412675 RepID=E5GBZ8_CUCME|nr:hypothetical protein [Cucumis melo subsp. melo]